jgi:hypothetical protein
MPLDINNTVISSTSVLETGYDNYVTDGLVLHYDAAQKHSHPCGGTTWYDLEGSNNATIVNGASIYRPYLGTLYLDGSDDYADFTAPNLSGTATVEMWARVGSWGGMFMGWTTYDVYTPGGRLGYNTGNSDVYGLSSGTVTSLGLLNNWKHYIFEMRTDVSYTNNKIYINKVQQTLSQQLSSESTGNRNFSSGNGRICGWRNSTGYPMRMNLAIFRVYNRILSQTEINQNFDAHKNRFGL